MEPVSFGRASPAPADELAAPDLAAVVNASVCAECLHTTVVGVPSLTDGSRGRETRANEWQEHGDAETQPKLQPERAAAYL